MRLSAHPEKIWSVNEEAANASTCCCFQRRETPIKWAKVDEHGARAEFALQTVAQVIFSLSRLKRITKNLCEIVCVCVCVVAPSSAALVDESEMYH